MATTKRYDVKDLALAPEGVAASVGRPADAGAGRDPRAVREGPAALGYRVSACLHVTTETANLARTLKAGGADVVLCASNPLVDAGRRRGGARRRVRHRHVRDQGRGQRQLLRAHRGGRRPQAALTMDDGADVIGVLHSARASSSATSSPAPRRRPPGVIRLKALEADGKLGFPIIAVNEAKTKHLFDNRLRHGPVDDRRHHPRDRTSCSPASASSSAATAGSGAASRRGPAAWART
jgi:adenosylhomocysteinase